MKRGAWVCNFDGDSPQFGRVVGVFKDSLGNYINVELYDNDGTFVGRRSPALGGPTRFEPALDPNRWVEIKPPEFPLEVVQIEDPTRLRFGTLPHFERV